MEIEGVDMLDGTLLLEIKFYVMDFDKRANMPSSRYPA